MGQSVSNQHPDPPRPEDLPVRVADWCAGRMEDPVSRLAFLRKSVGDRSIIRPIERRLRLPARLRLSRAQLKSIGAGVLVLAALTVLSNSSRVPSPNPAVPHPRTTAGTVTAAGPSVWMVEQSPQSELWSNGLRIERSFETNTQPRRYQALVRDAETNIAAPYRSLPAGIVFHTTESGMAELEENNRGRLRRMTAGLLGYVQQQRSYNFVIDRFGRVWRVVRELNAANHAGQSIWADEHTTYIGLNQSFLGVALELQSECAPDCLSPAQIESTRILVEMLRSRYGIAAQNCVTHAQVSVNPHNFLLGNHVDWLNGFPFAKAGLPDNYRIPPAAIRSFGFVASDGYRAEAAPALRSAIQTAEHERRQAATAANSDESTAIRSGRSRYQRLHRTHALEPDNLTAETSSAPN